MMSYKECQKRHKFGYIYKIINSINNKIYIGCTTNPELRFKKHKQSSINGNSKIHRAMRKYGFKNFRMEIIERVLLEDMYNVEKYFIEKYDSINKGYNTALGGEGGNTYAGKSEDEMQSIKHKLSEFQSSKGFFKLNNPVKAGYPHNKFLYLINIKDLSYIKMKAIDIKKCFGFEKYIEIRECVESKKIINDYLITESLETIERIASSKYEVKIE